MCFAYTIYNKYINIIYISNYEFITIKSYKLLIIGCLYYKSLGFYLFIINKIIIRSSIPYYYTFYKGAYLRLSKFNIDFYIRLYIFCFTNILNA